MDLDPKLIAFELVNFVVLMLVLRRFLFRPVRETLERRRRELEARTTELVEREAAARQAEQRSAARLDELEAEAERLRSEARRKGREEAEQLLSAARAAGEEVRRRGEQALAERERRVLANLRPRLLDLVVEGAGRLSSSLDAEPLVRGYARAAARSLLAAEARPTQLEVFHSPGCAPALVEEALRDELGAEVALELALDPELVAGVRLVHDDLEVEASAGSTLSTWARELEEVN